MVTTNKMSSVWNLSPDDIEKLDVWELWRPTKQGLRLALYKVMMPLDKIDSAVVFKKYLLYKGMLYKVIWQNDAAASYIDVDVPEHVEFIVSIRAKDDTKVALIQRLWK